MLIGIFIRRQLILSILWPFLFLWHVICVIKTFYVFIVYCAIWSMTIRLN